MLIGNRPTLSQQTFGYISEVTTFAANLSTTDRQTLEKNQGAYYGITTTQVTLGPLDYLSARPAAAFSTRLLTGTYAGKCMKVRRSSDNTTQDIGFVGGVLDTASLLAFVGAGNGFVDTWYDQSGNTRNAVQATTAAQPQIVIAGVVQTINAAPTVNFNGIFGGLSNNTYAAFIGAYTYNFVSQLDTISNYNYLLGNNLGTVGSFGFGTANTDLFSIGSSNGVSVTYNSYFYPLSTGMVLTNTSSAGASSSCIATLFTNGTSQGAITAGSIITQGAGFTIGSAGAVDTLRGRHSEVIMFASQISTTDRQTLERGQEAYYGIAGV
jgi:hypothetical protein